MSYGVGNEPDWAAMADQHDYEIRKQKRIKIIGAAVAATVVVGGITAGAVAMAGGSKGKPQTKDHAAVAASDGLGGGSSVAVDGSSASAAPSLSASASASASGSASAAPSLSASAKPGTAAGHSAGPSAAPAAPGAPASQAAPPAPGTGGRPDTSHGEIKNVHSGLALEIENSRMDDGAAADQWTYNPNNPTMSWYLHWVGDSWELRNVHSNMCLQIPNSPVGPAGNGIHADQWTCNGSAGQHWDLKPGMGGGQQIVNHQSGLCLEVENSQSTAGAVVQQWQCYNMGDHSWVLPS